MKRICIISLGLIVVFAYSAIAEYALTSSTLIGTDKTYALAVLTVGLVACAITIFMAIVLRSYLYMQAGISADKKIRTLLDSPAINYIGFDLKKITLSRNTYLEKLAFHLVLKISVHRKIVAAEILLTQNKQIRSPLLVGGCAL